MKLYQAIYYRLVGIEFYSKAGNADWQSIHTEALNNLINQLPHGSGIDSTYTVDLTAGSAGFVLRFDYHHMDKEGCYCGWSKYSVYVKGAILGGFELTIMGRDMNGTKEYLADTFYDSLSNQA